MLHDDKQPLYRRSLKRELLPGKLQPFFVITSADLFIVLIYQDGIKQTSYKKETKIVSYPLSVFPIETFNGLLLSRQF